MWVIVRGGLGNQMFQAAFATVLADRFSIKARFIDLSQHARVSRRWELGCFGIYPTQTSKFTLERLAATSYFAQKLNRMGFKSFRRYLIEGKNRVEISELTIAPNLIIGYWQNAKYLSDCKDLIKNKFCMPILPPGLDAPIPDDQRPSVAIHVRRGDYVNDPIARDLHLVCDADWYKRAWVNMRSKYPLARAFVFSDDPDWSKDNLQLEGDVSYTSCPPDSNSWVDMARMSACQHFIISNSTYSWWAAWLGSDLNKTVIAPKEWFRGRSTAEIGICPSDWIHL